MGSDSENDTSPKKIRHVQGRPFSAKIRSASPADNINKSRGGGKWGVFPTKRSSFNRTPSGQKSSSFKTPSGRAPKSTLCENASEAKRGQQSRPGFNFVSPLSRKSALEAFNFVKQEPTTDHPSDVGTTTSSSPENSSGIVPKTEQDVSAPDLDTEVPELEDTETNMDTVVSHLPENGPAWGHENATCELDIFVPEVEDTFPAPDVSQMPPLEDEMTDQDMSQEWENEVHLDSRVVPTKKLGSEVC